MSQSQDLSDAAFVEAAAHMGVILGARHLDLLRAYEELLRTWCERVRLVSKGDRGLIRQRHLLDSFSALPILPRGPIELLDIGSGGGLPGIPLHILRPDARTALLESTRMKALFLRHVKDELGFDGLEVVHLRAESHDAVAAHGRRYDVVCARALSDLPEIWRLGEPYLADGGQVVAYKGPGSAAEFERGVPDEIELSEIPVKVPGLGRERCLVVMRSRSR